MGSTRQRIGRLKHLILFFVSISFNLLAEDGGTEAHYILAIEPHLSTSVRTQVGFGLLDNPGITGSRGTPVLNFFEFEYALTPKYGIRVSVPLAGTLSGGPDNYGVGNVALGDKLVLSMDSWVVTLGGNISLPTAQSDAGVGLFTRQFVQFVEDQVAISPYVAVSHVRDRLVFSADVGTDVQIFTKSVPTRDRVEYIISYDGGMAYSFAPNLWTTAEVGGYSTLSYGDHLTSLYAGPGIRYQDYEMSLGFHVLAPLRTPARSVIDFLAFFDFRLLFD